MDVAGMGVADGRLRAGRGARHRNPRARPDREAGRRLHAPRARPAPPVRAAGVLLRALLDALPPLAARAGAGAVARGGRRARLEKEPHGRVAALLAVGEAQAVEALAQRGALARRHLEAAEHASEGGAVVPVVEERDVPAR